MAFKKYEVYRGNNGNPSFWEVSNGLHQHYLQTDLLINPSSRDRGLANYDINSNIVSVRSGNAFSTVTIPGGTADQIKSELENKLNIELRLLIENHGNKK